MTKCDEVEWSEVKPKMARWWVLGWSVMSRWSLVGAYEFIEEC